MDIAMEYPILGPPRFVSGPKSQPFLHCNRVLKLLYVNSRKVFRHPSRISSKVGNFRPYPNPGVAIASVSDARTLSRSLGKVSADLGVKQNAVLGMNLEIIRMLVRRAVVWSSVAMVFACKKAFAAEGVVNAGYGVIGQSILLLRNAWPQVLQLLKVFKEQGLVLAILLGLVLAILLGLSAFFSMAETSITTLWPWKDMIENVLEIKDTPVREVMTPLVDVVAIDASATFVDFHELWVTHQYSRVPVFEQYVDNIVGIAYAMDMLDYVRKTAELYSVSF